MKHQEDNSVKPADLHSIDFLIKKRNVFLYRGYCSQTPCIIKCTSSKAPNVLHAFYDEYHVMKTISVPGIPRYFWISEDFHPPGQEKAFLALCMEECPKEPAVDLAWCSPGDILSIVYDTSLLLYRLLQHGVLYTDLNPSNLILHREGDRISVCLVDFTYCYYFLKNPYPDYALRFSYDLSFELKGQQLLIRELGFLLKELMELSSPAEVPSGVYSLMETGLNPGSHLQLEDYISLIKNTALAL